MLQTVQGSAPPYIVVPNSWNDPLSSQLLGGLWGLGYFMRFGTADSSVWFASLEYDGSAIG